MLQTLILFPLITALISLVASKKWTMALTAVPLLLLLQPPLGQEIAYSWFSELSISFHLSCDSLSLLFLYLTNGLVLIVMATADKKAEASLVAVVQSNLNGLFLAQDLVLFTFFFEAMLIPVYIMLATWGYRKAALKFIVYMVTGSTLLIVALLMLYNEANSFALPTLATLAKTCPHASLIAAIFLFAFCVKTPLFPLHAWLVDAYTAGPLSATLLLSGLLSKAGIFGIIRISMGLFPELMIHWSPYLIGLAISGCLFGALAAWSQDDYKRLIAYSSLSHVNFILAGLFLCSPMGLMGALLQSINHAITITGLFLVADWLEKRINTCFIHGTSGLTAAYPRLSWLTLLFVLSTVALPGLNTFVSEIMVLFAALQQNILFAALLASTMVLSVLYMLRWTHAIYFQMPIEQKMHLPDLRKKEVLLSAPLVIAIVWLGIYPAQALQLIASNPIKIARKL